MNAWLVAATALLLGFVPCGWACLRGSLMARVVALEAANVLGVLVLLLLAEGFHRQIYFSTALALAFLGLPGVLVFTRVLERLR